MTLLYSQLKVFFKEVVVAKPRSSRNSSIGESSLVIASSTLGKYSKVMSMKTSCNYVFSCVYTVCMCRSTGTISFRSMHRFR